MSREIDVSLGKRHRQRSGCRCLLSSSLCVVAHKSFGRDGNRQNNEEGKTCEDVRENSMTFVEFVHHSGYIKISTLDDGRKKEVGSTSDLNEESLSCYVLYKLLTRMNSQLDSELEAVSISLLPNYDLVSSKVSPFYQH